MEKSGICYIVGAGECSGINFLKRENDFVIAADGGLRYLEAAGVIPDLLLGDFDSLGYRPQGTVLTYPKEKDETDTFLALRYAAANGYRTVRIFGGMGGRIDHTLANIQMLVWAARRGMDVRLCDGTTELMALCDGELSFPAECAGRISVFSMDNTAEGVDLLGLKYVLENGSLTNEFALGVSNEFIGCKSTVRVRCGTLLLVTETQPTADMQKAQA